MDRAEERETQGVTDHRQKGRGPLMRNDAREDLVELTQKMLVDLSYDLGSTGENQDGVDGVFGEITDTRVRDFQKEHEDWEGNPLDVDGRVGPETSDALNRAMVGLWYDEYVTPRELRGRPSSSRQRPNR